MTNGQKNYSSVTRNQHFVPKFYIKRFSDEKNFVKVLNLKEARTEKPKPYAGVCYEKFYYAVNTGVQDELSQEMEKYFKNLEDKIAKQINPIHNKLVDYNQSLNNEERYILSGFAAMLYLRGNYMREQMQRMSEEIFKKVMQLRADDSNFFQHVQEMSPDFGRPFTTEEVESYREMLIKKEYSIKFNNATHLSIFNKIEGFTNLFYNKNWIIYLAKGVKKFFTSDTPVIEWFPERVGFYGASFLDRKHYLPLSPEVLVEFIYPISDKKLKRKWVGDDEVYKYNIMRADLSMDYAYGIRNDEFNDLIKNHIDPALFRLAESIKKIQEKQ